MEFCEMMPIVCWDPSCLMHKGKQHNGPLTLPKKPWQWDHLCSGHISSRIKNLKSNLLSTWYNVCVYSATHTNPYSRVGIGWVQIALAAVPYPRDIVRHKSPGTWKPRNYSVQHSQQRRTSATIRNQRAQRLASLASTSTIFRLVQHGR